MSNSTQGVNLEHFNVPTSTRLQLISELAAALRRDSVPAAFWACLQICDLGRLREMITQATVNPIFVNFFAERCDEMMKIWTYWNRDRFPYSEKSDEDYARTKAKERDRSQCALLTGSPIDVAHIIPPSMMTENPEWIPTFFEMLSAFWSAEQVESWQNKICCNPEDPEQLLDECFNLICLSPSLHQMWGEGTMAFRPLDCYNGMKNLDIEIYFQPCQGHTLTDQVPIMKIPKSSEGLEHGQRVGTSLTRGFALWTENGWCSLRSGDKFTLTTEHPDTQPLPSRDLLEMQWYLGRLVSLSGVTQEYFEGWSRDGFTESTSRNEEDIQKWIEAVTGDSE